MKDRVYNLKNSIIFYPVIVFVVSTLTIMLLAVHQIHITFTIQNQSTFHPQSSSHSTITNKTVNDVNLENHSSVYRQKTRRFNNKEKNSADITDSIKRVVYLFFSMMVCGAVLIYYLGQRLYTNSVKERLAFEKERTELENKEWILDAIIENIPNMISVKSATNLNFMIFNKAGEELLGYSKKDLLGKNDHYFLPTEEAQSFINKDRKILEEGQLLDVAEERVKTKYGERYLHTKKVPIFNQQGKALFLLSISEDITINKKSEEKIRTLSNAVEQSPFAVIISDENCLIQYVNHAYLKMTEHLENEVLGKDLYFINQGNDTHGFSSALQDGTSWQGEIRSKNKFGKTYWEKIHLSPIKDKHKKLRNWLLIIQDISLQKKQAKTILHHAYYDHLTGLPNRLLGQDRLSELILEGKKSNNKFAVLFIDLDDFKKINDSLGHKFGDQLLIEASKRLKSTIREIDTVARLGGDEFIILLSNLNSVLYAANVAEKLIAKCKEPFVLENKKLVVTLSIGIAIYPSDGDDLSSLLRNADLAMYHSKNIGRNTYSFFSKEMKNKKNRKFLLEEQMLEALNRNEFHLLFQPKFDFKTKKILGVEALLRWNNRVLNNVSPYEFIPVAEQSNMINEIGEFVLNEALFLGRKWLSTASSNFTISVNLSPVQLRDKSLLLKIERCLERHDFPCESLEFEITEGVLLDDYHEVGNMIHKISDLGVKFALDDFGTGFSSLSYLRRYPFETLKIDKSLVKDITSNITDYELVNASIAMAHAMGMIVVAEGVETQEQFELLKNEHCDLAQGFLMGKPMTHDDISEILMFEKKTSILRRASLQ